MPKYLLLSGMIVALSKVSLCQGDGNNPDLVSMNLVWAEKNKDTNKWAKKLYEEERARIKSEALSEAKKISKWADVWDKAHEDPDSKEAKHLKLWAEENKDRNEWAQTVYEIDQARIESESLVNNNQKTNNWEVVWKRAQENPDSEEAKQVKMWAEKNKDSNEWAKKVYEDGQEKIKSQNKNNWEEVWKKARENPESEEAKQVKMWAEKDKDSNEWAKEVHEEILAKENQKTNNWEDVWKNAQENPDSDEAKQVKMWAEKNKDSNEWAKRVYEEDQEKIKAQDKNNWEEVWKKAQENPDSEEAEQVKMWAEKNKKSNEWAKKIHEEFLKKKNQQKDNWRNKVKKAQENPDSKEAKQVKMWAEKNKDSNEWAKKVHEQILAKENQKENSWEDVWKRAQENPDSEEAKQVKMWAEKNKDSNEWAKKVHEEFLAKENQKKMNWEDVWKKAEENPDSEEAKQVKMWAEKNKDKNEWAKKVYEERGGFLRGKRNW